MILRKLMAVILLLILTAALAVGGLFLYSRNHIMDGPGMENEYASPLSGRWHSEEDAYSEEEVVIQGNHLVHYVDGKVFAECDFSLVESGGSTYVKSINSSDLWFEYAEEETENGEVDGVLYLLMFATDDGGGYFRFSRLVHVDE